MAANQLKNLDAAREVAAWLGAHGQIGRGQTVQRVIASNEAYRLTVAALRREGERLRAACTPIARARNQPPRGPQTITLEVRRMVEELEQIRRVYEQHGGGPAIHVDDGAALIDLLRRVEEALA